MEINFHASRRTFVGCFVGVSQSMLLCHYGEGDVS